MSASHAWVYEPTVSVDLRDGGLSKSARGHDTVALMRMLRTISLVALAASLTVLAACGGSGKAIVPVDSPLMPWSPPEDQEKPAAAESAGTPATSDGKAPEQPKAK